MTFTLRLFYCLAAASLLLGCQTLGRDPLLGLTFRVIDDEGRPVEGAHVSFGGTRRPQHAAEGGQGVAIKGLTDAQGLFSGELEVWDATQAGYSVEKAGHYPARQISYSAKPAVRGRWQPWNPTIEVVLKRIKNPVPMYARKVETKVPEFDQPIGFDLVLSDWVAPYGKGQEADFIFLAQREVKSDREYDGSLTVRFAREGDGLLPWENHRPEATGLRMPYQAPEEGYLSEITWRENRGKNAAGDEMVFSSVSKTMNYFIRVRTKHDAQGRLASAQYGKIHGDIRWFIGTQASKSGLAFTYYLNPDGTRNVEYDPQRNLLRPAGSRDRAYDLAP